NLMRFMSFTHSQNPKLTETRRAKKFKASSGIVFILNKIQRDPFNILPHLRPRMPEAGCVRLGTKKRFQELLKNNRVFAEHVRKSTKVFEADQKTNRRIFSVALQLCSASWLT